MRAPRSPESLPIVGVKKIKKRTSKYARSRRAYHFPMHEDVSEYLNQHTIESWSNCAAEFLSTRKQEEEEDDDDEDDDSTNQGGNDNDEEENEGYSE